MIETLPQGWIETYLGELLDMIKGGGTPNKSNSLYFSGKIPFATVKDFKVTRPKDTIDHITEEAIENSSAELVPADVLLITTRMSIAKLARFKKPVAINQDVKALFLNNLVSKDFIEILLSFGAEKLIAKGTGTTVKGIRLEDIRNFEISLPPLAEQKRIVAKLEALLTRSTNARNELVAIPKLIERYKKAVLAAAFRGNLTADWREDNIALLDCSQQFLTAISTTRQSIYTNKIKKWEIEVKEWEKQGRIEKKPSKPSKSIEPDKLSPDHLEKMWEIPNTWNWLQLGNFAFVTKLAGFEYTDYVKYDPAGDLPVLKAENASLFGFKVTEYSKVHSQTISHLTRSHLLGGEILVVFVGAGTGNVALVPENQKFFLGPNIGMVRIESDLIDSHYLELFLRSTGGKELLLASMKAVAQPSISMGTIRQTPVVLPSLFEQKEIVERIQTAFKAIDTIQAELTQAEALRKRLEQATLAKAFKGELVPQNPNDEPASVLLERIRAEREAQPKSTKGRRGKHG
jgi:type I restriction enzyme S subunit